MYKDLCVVFAEDIPPACVGVVVIVKGTEGCAVPSRCDVNSDKTCVLSELCLGFRWSQECRFFFLNFIKFNFFYFFWKGGGGGG